MAFRLPVFGVPTILVSRKPIFPMTFNAEALGCEEYASAPDKNEEFLRSFGAEEACMHQPNPKF